MKISIFTVLLQNRTLEESIKITSELGYDGIEIMCRAPHISDDTSLSEIEKYKKLLQKNHLPVVNLATYIGNFSRGLSGKADGCLKVSRKVKI